MGIKASRCKQCSRAIVPPRNMCPYCGGKAAEMVQLELDNQGTVLSYTILHTPPEGFKPPVFLALIELQHKAVILCNGDPRDINQISIGTTVFVSQNKAGLFQFSPLTH